MPATLEQVVQELEKFINTSEEGRRLKSRPILSASDDLKKEPIGSWFSTIKGLQEAE